MRIIEKVKVALVDEQTADELDELHVELKMHTNTTAARLKAITTKDGDTFGGNLGHALANYRAFAERGFRLAAPRDAAGGRGGVSFAGDYFGMAVAGDRVAPVYIQMGPGSNEDIYTNVIEFASCPWDCGDGDGAVGMNDFRALPASGGGWARSGRYPVTSSSD